MKKCLLVLALIGSFWAGQALAQGELGATKTSEERSLEQDYLNKAVAIDREFREGNARLISQKMHPDLLNLYKIQTLEWYEFRKEMNDAEFEVRMKHLQEEQKVKKAIDASKLINQR